MGRKPRLAFFQWDHQPNAGAANYLLLHMQQHVKCLAHHFEVTVVNSDCDYDEVCDRLRPDLTLFESGYRSHGSRRISIANTHRHPGIPKLGLHNGDPWCDRRSGFLSDMDHWGVETFFSISTLMPAYTPTIAANTFVWPNAVDPDIFHDYGQEKSVPVALTGQSYGLYPWRQSVFPAIIQCFPCLVSPSHAYESKAASRLLSGERYARALNASFAAPTCGTVGGEVVRKHFEIPASMALLVTERTAGLEAAGFRDMENCVFADHRDVVDKLDHLFARPDELRRITKAGYDLVHSRHTLAHRPQIHQWFTLRQGLPADEIIIQNGPFGDLVRARRDEGRASAPVAAGGFDRVLLEKAAANLKHGRIGPAHEAYARCLDYVSYMPEAKFGLGLCALREGNAVEACVLFGALVDVTTGAYGAADPDPVDWAYYLLSLVCAGRLDEAARLLDSYSTLSHTEFNRVRALVDRLWPRQRRLQIAARNRQSVHMVAVRSDSEWLRWVCDTLRRCGQGALADSLGRGDDATSPPGQPPVRLRGSVSPPIQRLRSQLYAGVDRIVAAAGFEDARPTVPPAPEFRYFSRLARNLARAALGGRQAPARATLARLVERVRSGRTRKAQVRTRAIQLIAVRVVGVPP